MEIPTPKSNKVSVIIAAYNAAPYISRAIKSAISQKYINVEIVAVDDSSTDNTWRILQEWSKDPRIKAYRLSHNSGPSAARNHAIKNSSGEWIAILDADDAFDKDRLNRCIDKAEKYQADIVIDNLKVIQNGRETYNLISDKRFNKYNILKLEDYIDGNHIGKNGLNLGYTKPILSRKFITETNISYNTNLRIGEDYFLIAEALALGGKCVIEHTAGYLYTVRDGSTSYRLSCDDIKAMQSSDFQLMTQFSLSEKAIAAQKRREKNLNDYYAFTILVDALKNKDIMKVFKALVISPTSPRHLTEAIGKRLPFSWPSKALKSI